MCYTVTHLHVLLLVSYKLAAPRIRFLFGHLFLNKSSTTVNSRRLHGVPRRAVPTTESERVPVKSCANDEVAKCGRTGITIAYTENMLCRERTHGLHNAQLTRREHNLLGAGGDLEAR